MNLRDEVARGVAEALGVGLPFTKGSIGFRVLERVIPLIPEGEGEAPTR